MYDDISKSRKNRKEEVSKWTCQFKLKALERAYLISKLKQDKKITRFLILIIAIILSLILFLDKLIIKPEYWPNPALAWRGGLVLVCIITVFLLPKIKKIRHLQTCVLVFILFFLANLQAMVLTYQDHYILHVFLMLSS